MLEEWVGHAVWHRRSNAALTALGQLLGLGYNLRRVAEVLRSNCHWFEVSTTCCTTRLASHSTSNVGQRFRR